MGVKCVKCGSNNTATYLYGMPKFDEQLEKNIAEHKVILGGCMVTELDPKFYCNECKRNFGYSAKRLYDNKIINYIEETNYYMFSMNYPACGETKLILTKEKNKYFARIYRQGKKFEKEISEKEYKKNLTTIFDKAYVLEWNKEYIILPKVDGTKWKVEIRCDNGKPFTSSGKNCFPPYFRKAKSRHDYYSIKFK